MYLYRINVNSWLCIQMLYYYKHFDTCYKLNVVYKLTDTL